MAAGKMKSTTWVPGKRVTGTRKSCCATTVHASTDICRREIEYVEIIETGSGFVDPNSMSTVDGNAIRSGR